MEEAGAYTEHLNSETVWANSREAGKKQEETDRIIKETWQIVKENARIIGKLGNRYGEMIEYMVKPCLVEKFQELGFEFTEASQNRIIKDKKNNIITEVDFTLEDGDRVMLVEIKSKPDTDDIKEHIERMEKIRTYARLHNDNRIYLGAIGGMVIDDNVKTFALKSGFYVVEPSGETFAITVPEGIYSPREW